MSELIEPTQRLTEALSGLEFGDPVACVYRPLEYAWEPHAEYLARFGKGRKRVVFLGMNPGPYGMAQTGVPFGEVAMVRDWMGIEKPVGKPRDEHAKRPVTGFGCERSEVSGRRLWGLFAEKFGTPDAFFADHFILNFCPLVWMKDTGANLTPDKIRGSEMAPVEEACRAHLREVLEILEPEYFVGVGAYAEKHLVRAAEELGSDAVVGRVLHPSPASPAANRGWGPAATKQLEALGIW